ncbi:MAG: hypothetical protein EAZ95_07900 [Bacteroidetes bacterium]|nr:MAG: hypothetical protein EAZ95_07900 [Bacteroidota bacterium]
MKEFVEGLPTKKQIDLALTFAQKALPIWEKYALSSDLTYCDTVIGMRHTIDKKILPKTIQAIQKSLTSSDKTPLKTLLEEFSEPIVALQDEDWSLPEAVLKTFYSVYNLLGGVAGKETTIFGENSFYVSLNQSIDALLVAKLLPIQDIRHILGIDA